MNWAVSGDTLYFTQQDPAGEVAFFAFKDGAVSLLVDEIGDVVEVADDAYERGPETLSPTTRELISGVYKLKRELLLLLDTERAASVPDPKRSSAEEAA